LAFKDLHMMKLVLLACLLSIAVALPALKHEEYNFLFSKWAKQHSKSYATPQERSQRLAIFTANLDYIRAHQANPNRTWELRMNKFGDLSNDEFVAQYTGYTPIQRSLSRSKNEQTIDLPRRILDADVDWRSTGQVTPIKDQGQCGSCWAFSAVGSTESCYAVENNVKATVEASEQQLVDCGGAEGNQGCNGGLMDYAFQFIIDNNGICTEQGYPYTAQDGTCKKTCTKTLTITAFKDVPANNAAQLVAAVQTRPVSVAVDAGGSDWQFYSGGILNDAGCGTSLDHGVLIVGHITSGSTPYWIVKNSWGTSWGNQGYIYIADDGKNDAGICGINMDPSYPTGCSKIASVRKH
jgi:C1A family cysteine protease